jgi:predicted RNA-binding protein with PIN domain
MERWLVDGMNVVGSRPDGWWRDRRGAMRALAAELGRFARESGGSVTVVFDGRPFRAGASGVEVAFARRGGPNAADDEIARLVAADSNPRAIRVVTSDAELAKRVREHGAEVVSASAFRRLLDEHAPASGGCHPAG